MQANVYVLGVVSQWLAPRRRACNPLQYSCLENPHGQRSLAGYSPRGHRDLDMTRQLRPAQPMARRNASQHNGEQEAVDCQVVPVFRGQCQCPPPFVPHACCTGNRGLEPLCFRNCNSTFLPCSARLLHQLEGKKRKAQKEE